MEILNKYPEAKKKFIGYMIETYGVTEQQFNVAPYIEQCRAICRYIGYPIDIENIKDVDSHIDNILYLYDNSIQDKTFVHPFKLINKMNYQEREDSFKFNTPEIVLLGIANSLIPLPTNISVNCFLSLKDSLVIFINPKQKDNTDKIVWDLIIKQFFNHETVPF